MGVYESYAKIKKTAQKMDIVWEQTRAVWKDAKGAQFEEEFVKRLSIEIKKAQIAMENVGIILNQIRSELKE